MDVISADTPVSEPDEVQEERSGKASAPKGVAMPLLVLNGTTLFPNVVMHMEVLKSDAVSALYAAAKGNKLIFVTGRNDEDDSKVYPLHSDHVLFDERAMEIGISVLVQTAVDLLDTLNA